jgi:Uncharacterized conserved protein
MHVSHSLARAAVTAAEPAPLDPALFRAPLDFLGADHAFQADLCDTLRRLIHNPRHGASADEIESLCEYFARDLALHNMDEEQSLLPFLALRCRPEDGLEAIASRLRKEHDVMHRLGMALLIELERLTSGRAFKDAGNFFDVAAHFLHLLATHMAWENAELLPLARRRLVPDDIVALGRDMAARRGVKPVL